MNGAQMATTQPLPPGSIFAVIYVHVGHQPMTAVMNDPPPEWLDAQVQAQAKVAGPSGAPILKPPEKIRFLKILHFPTVGIVVYASKPCVDAIDAREKALQDAKAAAAADAVAGQPEARGDVMEETLAQIRRLPVVRPPPAE